MTHNVMTLYLPPFSKMLLPMAEHMAYCLQVLQNKDNQVPQNQDLFDRIHT